MTDQLLAAAQSHLQVLADQLEERGDKRAATVRLLGQDLFRLVEEFERLQELEMVAGDLWRNDSPKLPANIYEGLGRFFKAT